MSDWVGPEVVVAAGPRAVERLLLDRLADVLARCVDDLEPPVRVVVPSRSLRLHVTHRVVQEEGRAVASLVVQTLHTLALEVLERAGEAPPTGASAFDVLVCRLARQEPVLNRSLDHLDDGYGAVMATVRDLLDAGLEPVHEEPLVEQLDAIPPEVLGESVVGRAKALVRVAARVAEGAELLGTGRSSTLLRRAAELVAADPGAVLPSRKVLVHGFADVTGTAADLLGAVVRHCAATVLLDLPADPCAAGSADAGAGFVSRFAERLGARVAADRANPPLTRWQVLVAPDPEAEVREVVSRVRTLVAAGTHPESVGVVARDLPAYSAIVRRHCERLGVPYSGVGTEVPSGPLRRRARAAARLLTLQQRAPTEVWLQAVAPDFDPDIAKLALGLRTAGVSRLGDVPGLAVTESERWGETGPGARSLVSRAERSLEIFRSWPDRAPADEHLERTQQILDPLGVENGDEAIELVVAEIEAVAGDLPRGWHVEGGEWLELVSRALERVGTVPLGGAGGGVQILNVMEARAMTFSHLFVVGLNRDVFPRVVREDPLLPDTVRGRLAVVLPDVPIKERGWDEERYLFAQLLWAGDRVTLSRCRSAGGREAAASPFLERLPVADAAETVPGVWSAGGERSSREPRPAFEHAVLAGLGGNRQTWRRVLELAISEGRARTTRSTLSLWPAASVAAARQAVLDELDPEAEARRGLGPFTGCVGGLGAGGAWPRELSVTLLEAVARCPWQALVSRVLGVGPAPDPLLELPDPTARLLGTVVHGVLEQIVRSAEGEEDAMPDAGSDAPAKVPWPPPERLDQILDSEARRVARGQGLLLLGLTPMIEVLARPYLDVARMVDWSAEPPAVIGAEVDGLVDLREGERLRFRADRIDEGRNGPVFTDYKTGAFPDRKLATKVARGEMLQAVAYVVAQVGARAKGRYLYLRPDGDRAESRSRCYEVGSDDRELVRSFENAISTVVTAMRHGAFIPRVADRGRDGEPGWCAGCRVAEACLRSDSGFKRRLLEWRWTEPAVERDAAAAAVEAAARALWWLGEERRESDDGAGQAKPVGSS